MRNYASFKGEYSNGTLYSTTKSAYIQYIKIDPTIELSKTLRNRKINYFINDFVDYTLNITGRQLLSGAEVELNQIVDILPDGLEYVTGSATITVSTSSIYGTTLPRGTSLFEPEIVYNYKGTGKTALVWELKPFSNQSSNFITSASNFYSIRYSTKITDITKMGANTNTAYLSWQNNDEVKPYNNAVADQFDLNENGSTEDLITQGSININYVPPRELIIRKEVKGSLDNNFILPPSTGLGEIDTVMQYQFTLFNNSVLDITTLHLLDILPVIGDKTVSTDMSISEPVRIERGSTFPLKLTEAISVPEGYQVMYTTDSTLNISDVKDFYNNANWVDTLTDYSEATAFKVILSSGSVLLSGEEKIFTVSFSIPRDMDLEEVDQAVNSFGVATTNGLNFFESNLSTIKIVKYNVNGYIFDDFNENGLFDTGDDATFSNYQVQLVDENGNAVLDLDGEPYQVLTDENGYYSIDVYRQGNYKIKVLTPDGYQVTNKVSDALGSDMNNETLTDTFVLNPQNVEARKNAGYYRETVTLAFDKVLLNAEGSPLINDEEFTFTIKIDGNLYQGDISVEGETVTTSTGTITLKGGQKAVIDSIAKGVSYSIKETSTTSYQVRPESGEYSGTANETFISVTFTNTYVITKTEVTVNKVWVGGPEEKPVIQVQLYRDGEAYLDAVTLDGSTSYTWTELDSTDKNGVQYVYTVDEVAVPENYEKVVDGLTITNTYVITNTYIQPPKPQPQPKNPCPDCVVYAVPNTATDNNIMLFVVLTLLAGVGLYLVNKKRK